MEADADFIGIERAHVDAGLGADGNVQTRRAAVVHAGEVDEGGRHRVAARNGHVQTKLHLLRIERDPRVGAHQASVVGLGGDADELHARHLLAGHRGIGHHQTKIEISNGKTDCVWVGCFVVEVEVTVGVGEVGPVDAGKG